MAATIPQGIRRVIPILSSAGGTASASNCRVSPRKCAPSNAASRNISAARPASPRASVMGFPTSATKVCASDSARASHKSAARRKIAARAWAGILAISRAPSAAASSARAMSPAPARGTVSTASPENGEQTSIWDSPAVHSPATSIFIAMTPFGLLADFVFEIRNANRQRDCEM